jgi:hypothetical protein
MLDHDGRRRLLYNAVTLLEPYASAALIQHYVVRRHDVTLPLLRIYVDLERLVGAGRLIRHIKPRLGKARPFSGKRLAWSSSSLIGILSIYSPSERRYRPLRREICMLRDWSLSFP